MGSPTTQGSLIAKQKHYRLQRKKGTLPIAPIGENAIDMMQRDLTLCEQCGINTDKVIAHWKRTAKKYDIDLGHIE